MRTYLPTSCQVPPAAYLQHAILVGQEVLQVRSMHVNALLQQLYALGAGQRGLLQQLLQCFDARLVHITQALRAGRQGSWLLSTNRSMKLQGRSSGKPSSKIRPTTGT